MTELVCYRTISTFSTCSQTKATGNATKSVAEKLLNVNLNIISNIIVIKLIDTVLMFMLASALHLGPSYALGNLSACKPRAETTVECMTFRWYCMRKSQALFCMWYNSMIRWKQDFSFYCILEKVLTLLEMGSCRVKTVIKDLYAGYFTEH